MAESPRIKAVFIVLLSKTSVSMVAAHSPAPMKRRSMNDPPNLSEATPLRIVLLGKSASETSLVGNSILDRSAFDSDYFPDVVDRVGGRVKDRHITLIYSPQLLQTNISDYQITQMVRKCVSLSDPGPHVFIITLQYRDFTEEDMRRVKYVLNTFSVEAIRRTIIVTTDEETQDAERAAEDLNEFILQLTAECGGGRLDLEQCRSILSKQLEKILRENNLEFLPCDPSYYAEEPSFSELSSSFYSLRTEEEDSVEEYDGKAQETPAEKSKTKGVHRKISIASFFSFRGKRSEHERAKGVRVTSTQRLNLVLCGSDGRLKASISKLIRGKKKFLPPLRQKCCVRKDVELHGRLLSLVELPALFNPGLSEEEVVRHSHHCVSLCDAGVHAFLIIIPDAPLTDESKSEIKEIQTMFSSRINKHVVILIIQEKSIFSKLISSKSSLYQTSFFETSVQTFGGRHFVLENSSQVPDLLQYVEDMVRDNGGGLYTTFMHLQAQIELERYKHKAEIEELRSVTKTQLTAGVTHDDLRIVLLGKTGVGKSASGNTILRKQAFQSLLASQSVTRECEKETSEFNRRQITVIDTPGLFDTGVDNVEIRKEIVKCVSMAAPGPHVFLLVIELRRFTQEEKDAVKMIQETFGDKSRMYTMVLFTRGDDLRGTSVEDFIVGDRSLQYLILQCGQRYHVFNNKDSKDRRQVSELLEKIDFMVTANGGSFYTNEMFEQVEMNIRKEQERIMNERKEEMKRKEEELRAKYDTDIEKMKKENERERQEMQNELRKSEEEFKKKEEEIKKEKDESLQKELQRKLEEQQKLFDKESKRKENALGEQQQNFIKYLEEKHEKEKQKLKEQIEREIREQAEHEYLVKLDSEVAKALKEAEEKLPSCAKRARDWSQYGWFVGAAAGSVFGTCEDIASWIVRKDSKY